MRLSRRAFYCAVVVFGANIFAATVFLRAEFQIAISNGWLIAASLVFAVAILFIVIVPQRKQDMSARLRRLSDGCELLTIFIISVFFTTLIQLFMAVWALRIVLPDHGAASASMLAWWLCGLAIAIICQAVIFWGGMLRIYLTSVQLGIKHRVLGALFAWIPGLNIYYLLQLVSVCRAEVDFESEKQALNAVRAENKRCETKYPVLMVHGVFFRDFRYFNYWGRVPAELVRNGATVYYGHQQSAASVEDSAKELAANIRKVIEETGSPKVNIIAHSKGGLDCRAAISRHGAAPYVASLTTINTPHRGCLFAEQLLTKMPHRAYLSIARTYNGALKRMGDPSPDFVAAVTDLTASTCEQFNKDTPDDPGVLYESVMSYCLKAQSGKFPINMSYPIVKWYDGKNDGLVAIESARWGDRFTVLEPRGKRGISHGDMIDLNRENIADFDVREFYVSLVSGLKQRGY